MNQIPVLGWVDSALASVLGVCLLIAWVVGMLMLSLAGLLVVQETLRRRDRDEMAPNPVNEDLAGGTEPPAALSPAMATLILRRRPSRRSSTVALVELAERELMRFEETPGFASHAIGLRVLKEEIRPHHGLARPERELFEGIRKVATHTGGAIGPESLYLLDRTFDRFERDLEASAVARGWLRSEWHPIRDVWYLVAALEFALAAMGLTVGLLGPSFVVLLTGPTWLLAAVSTVLVVRTMPARTSRGAATCSWLLTEASGLAARVREARSMNDVSIDRLSRHSSPDEAVAWALAFGLETEVRGVFARSIANHVSGGTSELWLPGWWVEAQRISVRRVRRPTFEASHWAAVRRRVRDRLEAMSVRLDYRLSRSPVTDLVRDLDPRRASPSARTDPSTPTEPQ